MRTLLMLENTMEQDIVLSLSCGIRRSKHSTNTTDLTSEHYRRLTVQKHNGLLGSWTVAWRRPHPYLSPYVRLLWYGEGYINYHRDRILPTNGGSLLLFNLGPTQYRIEPGPPEYRVPFNDIWYIGPRQTPVDAEAPHGMALLGIFFTSLGGRPWLHNDAYLMAEEVVPLADILGDQVLRLRQRLFELQEIESRFDCIEQWLLSRISPGHLPHPLLSWGLQQIEVERGNLSVSVLARDAGISRKHFTSLFRREVGITPKAFARLNRFKTVLELMAGKSHIPWTELATHCGYFDQSHLIRDFRFYTGYSPGEFIRLSRPDSTSIVIDNG